MFIAYVGDTSATFTVYIHRSQQVKDFISEKINEKAEQYLGVAMTYTLIELVKDNLENWFIEVSKQLPVKVSPKEEITLVEEVSNLVSINVLFQSIFT